VKGENKPTPGPSFQGGEAVKDISQPELRELDREIEEGEGVFKLNNKKWIFVVSLQSIS
jgi:hypothetical protein